MDHTLTGQQRVDSIVDHLTTTCPDFKPKEKFTAVIEAGSGCNRLRELIDIMYTVDCRSVSGYPVAPNKHGDHAGQILLGTLKGHPDIQVIILAGRVHLYQGFEAYETAIPVWAMHQWGADFFFITNAAGVLKKSIPLGSPAIITDVRNMQHQTVGMTALENLPVKTATHNARANLTNPELRMLLALIMEQAGVEHTEGAYNAKTGPEYESPIEVRELIMLSILLAGMSTATVLDMLKRLGAMVVAVSGCSNYGEGLSTEPIDHGGVERNMQHFVDTMLIVLPVYLVQVRDMLMRD